ncbi:MAG: hypothetical protein EXR35_00975 [Limnohabitans sp.]|nr:hypothetical protein [Limnohabitans sp.]
MNQFESFNITHQTVFSNTKEQILAAMSKKNYNFVSVAFMKSWLGFSNYVIRDFQRYWENLKVDHYINDGGTYRSRRYGAFELTKALELHLLPHAPYEQRAYINKLNGGITRIDDLLKKGFIDNKLFPQLI